MFRIVEVGARDGLQNESVVVPTATKVAFINALSRSGVNEIEVSSFVSPHWVPQLADAEDVFAAIERNPDVIYSALVPNERGLDRALVARPDKVAVFTAVSETFNQKNVNTSVEGSLERLMKVVPRALREKLRVRGYISTVFWCPYEGAMDPERVVDIAERLVDVGCAFVALGDTVGRATPDEVRRVLDLMIPRLGADHIAMHFHDTFGRAADNVRTAVEMGIRKFDSSVGGLGGCPYAGEGAAGNVATQVVVDAIADCGYETGVDAESLARAYEIVTQALVQGGQ